MRLAQAAQHADAVDIRHHDVEQDGVEPLLLGETERLAAAVRLGHVEAPPLEAAREDRPVLGNVIHDQEPGESLERAQATWRRTLSR